jgi:hypothetical protein
LRRIAGLLTFTTLKGIRLSFGSRQGDMLRTMIMLSAMTIKPEVIFQVLISGLLASTDNQYCGLRTASLRVVSRVPSIVPQFKGVIMNIHHRAVMLALLSPSQLTITQNGGRYET